MGRLLFILCAALVVVALVSFTVSLASRAVQDSTKLAREITTGTQGNTMQKIGFAALIIVMLGVTSGLLGGL